MMPVNLSRAEKKEELHLNMQQLHEGLDHILASPQDNGILALIVRRPAEDAREVLAEGELSLEMGLVGDTWNKRQSSQTPDKSPHPDMQINIMNARAISLIAQQEDRWPLAGDQLYIDIDLSDANLAPGTQLSIGEAILEITPQPHNGCKKFVDRFGLDAMKFVNSELGKKHHLRGVNAKVVKPGKIRKGDTVRKLFI